VREAVLFALLGLGSGALIAGVALGVVLTYRGSGIINVATGAVAMVAGYAFWALKSGEIGGGMGTVPALVITLAVALGMGALMELTAFRPLRAASPLAKLVSSLGVLLVAQATVILAFGPNPKPAPSILPGGTVLLFDVTVPVNRFFLAGIVVVAAAALAALYRWSGFGLATRAAAENEVFATLAGLSPDRLAMANTLLASLVAGGLGVLAAALTQLNAITLPLVVVPALAAALFARFTSFAIACAAGLAIGMGQSILDYLSTFNWFPHDQGTALPGIKDLFVFLVIVVAMFWRGASMPGRGELVEKRLPAAPRPERLLRPAVILTLLCAVALVVFPFDFRQALINSMIGTVILLSLVVITGFVGQVSVVQLALSGIAGFAISHLAVDAGIGFPLAPIIAVAGATVIGLLTAVSALRVRGVSLAVVTLAAAVAIEQFVFANSTWGGGTSGGSPVPQPELLGIQLGSTAPFRGLDDKLPSPILGFGVLAVTVALCLLVAALRRSALGQRMLAVRSNERAAAAAGVDVRAVKLTAFGISAFIAGVAGALFAYDFGSVSATRYDALTALGLIAFAYLGGITMVSGAVLGGLVTTEALLPHALDRWILPESQTGTYTLLVGGIALLATLIANPEGIAGTKHAKQQRRARGAGRAEAPPGGDGRSDRAGGRRTAAVGER
jgi:branched-subunit amino acid ABC-type transport system permease component